MQSGYVSEMHLLQIIRWRPRSGISSSICSITVFQLPSLCLIGRTTVVLTFMPSPLWVNHTVCRSYRATSLSKRYPKRTFAVYSSSQSALPTHLIRIDLACPHHIPDNKVMIFRNILWKKILEKQVKKQYGLSASAYACDDFYFTVPHTVNQPVHIGVSFNHAFHLALWTK